MKKKVIADIVHGYIAINEIDQEFIHLPLFQRLTRITQGLNRGAFPNCNHTRFEHSLGVAHLGTKVIDSLIEKSKSKDERKELQKLRDSVRTACLLHDIGHAPFSHIGELFYNKKKCIDQLCKLRGEEYRDTFGNASPHELMSALVIMKDPDINCIFNKNSLDKNFIIDMICGFEKKHIDTIRFPLIQLLNSQIDVDRLDYVLRDNMMAGGTFVSLDVERMISAYIINKNKLRLSYQALSTIANFMNGRSNLYLFVLNHHRNVLNNGLHYVFINELKEQKIIKANDYFSFSAITKKRMDDFDLGSIMKKHVNLNDTTKLCGNHIFSRGFLSPIWKDGFECSEIIANNKKVKFNLYNFIKETSPRLSQYEEHIKAELNISEPLYIFYCLNKYYKSPTDDSERGSVTILMRDDSEKQYHELFHSAQIVKTDPFYFYVYLSNNSNMKDDLRMYFSRNN